MTEYHTDRPDEHHEGEHFADEAAFTHDAPEAAADSAFGERHDTVDGPEAPRSQQEQLGQNLRKAAEDTAYAAVGFVGLMADKAKEFYEDQKKQYAESHPDAEGEQGAKNFINQLREQLDRFIDDVNRGFRDLADRGRASGKDATTTGTHGAEGSDQPNDENKDYTI
ncbi:hypothetical protein GCM10025789_08620 [Tessaracoccus lubricantis]|uniref:Uncharacterized protein n=1 Tax=Tessaracoccus lubricantis TaxID=545543 RepID=A0ABP9F697_9ACTN